MRTGIIFLLIVMAVLCNGCVLAKAQNYAELNWLGDNDPDTRIPVTCGVPWPRAVHKKDTTVGRPGPSRLYLFRYRRPEISVHRYTAPVP